MSVAISIQGTTINIPSSGESPNWSPAIIEAFQAIAQALTQVVGAFDISPQTYIMTSNSNTNVDIPNLSFPTSTVRGAFIKYTVYRNTTLTTVVEAGTIYVEYNPSASVGQKWSITREYVGDAKVTFNITDVGQVQFSSTALTGSTHNGIISYSAQALLQS
jgi:hypothetical protein